MPHHPRHGSTYGTVTNHTAKFVTFSPDDSPDRRIRILPKSLLSLSPRATPLSARQRGTTRRHIALPESDGDESRTAKEREQDNDIYDTLPETANVPVANGYVSFTRTFRYLGSLINFSLRDDDDITARIAAATAAMGALKEIWRNPHLDTFNKYMLFRAIPMNLLLWGAETWSLRKTQLDQLEIFLHCNIRRILQISMSKVKEEQIRNDKVRQMFYSIPCVRNMIAARQMDLIGKMIRGPPDRPSRNMITACCDHKRRVGRPQTTRKNFMVENLRLLFKDVHTVNIDRFGSLQDWIHEANAEDYWNQLVKRLLHPDTPLPARPESWGPLPSWRARCGTSERRTPADENSDDDDNESNTANDDYYGASGRGEQQNNSRGREEHQPPPSPRAPPPRTNTDNTLPPPPLRNTIRNGGFAMRIFARRWEEACFNRSPSSDSDWVHPRRKLKYTIDNLLGNITLTRIIQQSLAWTLQNLLSFFNSSTMRTSTSESAHKLLCQTPPFENSMSRLKR